MPAYAAHFLFAEDCLKRINKQDPDFIVNRNAFNFGAQGPDFLFCHKVWRMIWRGKTLKPVGTALHNCKISRLLGLMKKYMNDETDHKDIIKSYIYGFICHYSLDRFTHPLIYSMQNSIIEEKQLKGKEPFAVHARIESNIDTIMLNRAGYDDARIFRGQDQIKNDKEVIDEISAMMAYAVPLSLNTAKDKKQYALAYKHMLLSQKALYDPQGLKYKMLIKLGGPVRKKIGPVISSMVKPAIPEAYDFVNRQHKQWTMVYDKKKSSKKSFFDLYENAKDDAMKLIDAFNQKDAEKAIQNICDDMSFGTGLNYKIKKPLN